MGQCGSLWVRRGSSKKSRKCGSFSELWVSVGQCGSGGGSSKKSRKCGSFSELWVSVGLLGNFGSLWVRR